MKIIVCIKQVPATDDLSIDREKKQVIREGVELTINPLCSHAVEAALQVKEQTGATVTAVTLGPPPAEAVCRRAMAMGCDAGLLVTDRLFAGSDTWSTAVGLAAAVRYLGGADLVFCGDHTSDGDTGQVPAELAEVLDVPQASFACAVAVIDGKLRVRRLLEGVVETVEMPMPALVSVVKDVGRVRRPSLRGLRRAATLEIPQVSAETLGLKHEDVGWKGSPTKTLNLYRPPARPGVQKFDEPPVQAADRILDLLAEMGVS